MAGRPEIGGVPNYYPWATTDITEVVNDKGKVLFLDNKKQPLSEHIRYGLKFNQPINYQEFNYQLNGYSQWFEFLDKQKEIGDLHYSTNPSYVSDERLGGTWTQIGTETVGSTTVYVYQKVS